MDKKLLKRAAREWGDRADVRVFVFDELSQLENKRVLEVGCGKGFLLAALPSSNKAFGIDLSDENITQAKKNAPNAVIKKASMYEIPFPASSFDVVVISNALPGVDFTIYGTEVKRRAFREKTLKEIKRVLKPSGVLILTTPNGDYGNWPGKIKLSELEALLKKAGFNFFIQGWNPFPPLLPPSRVLVKIPGWFHTLKSMSKRMRPNKGKFFYVEARKR